MVSVNKTRAAMAQDVNRAVNGAEMIGFNEEGHACVWSGGYGFNVYDAANGWNEIDNFSDGRMVDWADEEQARERMESEGFTVV